MAWASRRLNRSSLLCQSLYRDTSIPHSCSKEKCLESQKPVHARDSDQCSLLDSLTLYHPRVYLRSSGGSKRRTFGGLGELLVLRQCHKPRVVLAHGELASPWYMPSKLNQDCLHGVFSFPLRQTGEPGRVHLENRLSRRCLKGPRSQTYPPTALIDTWEIDLGNELNSRWYVRIDVAAVDVDAVDAIFMNTLS